MIHFGYNTINIYILLSIICCIFVSSSHVNTILSIYNNRNVENSIMAPLQNNANDLHITEISLPTARTRRSHFDFSFKSQYDEISAEIIVQPICGMTQPIKKNIPLSAMRTPAAGIGLTSTVFSTRSQLTWGDLFNSITLCEIPRFEINIYNTVDSNLIENTTYPFETDPLAVVPAEELIIKTGISSGTIHTIDDILALDYTYQNIITSTESDIVYSIDSKTQYYRHITIYWFGWLPSSSIKEVNITFYQKDVQSSCGFDSICFKQMEVKPSTNMNGIYTFISSVMIPQDCFMNVDFERNSITYTISYKIVDFTIDKQYSPYNFEKASSNTVSYRVYTSPIQYTSTLINTDMYDKNKTTTINMVSSGSSPSELITQQIDVITNTISLRFLAYPSHDLTCQLSLAGYTQENGNFLPSNYYYPIGELVIPKGGKVGQTTYNLSQLEINKAIRGGLDLMRQHGSSSLDELFYPFHFSVQLRHCYNVPSDILYQPNTELISLFSLKPVLAVPRALISLKPVLKAGTHKEVYVNKVESKETMSLTTIGPQVGTPGMMVTFSLKTLGISYTQINNRSDYYTKVIFTGLYSTLQQQQISTAFSIEWKRDDINRILPLISTEGVLSREYLQYISLPRLAYLLFDKGYIDVHTIVELQAEITISDTQLDIDSNYSVLDVFFQPYEVVVTPKIDLKLCLPPYSSDCSSNLQDKCISLNTIPWDHSDPLRDPNQCLCRDGFTGVRCQQPKECEVTLNILNGCSNNGFIPSIVDIKGNTKCKTECECYDGYFGPTCQHNERCATDSTVCNGNGYIDFTATGCGSCICDLGWSGSECETQACSLAYQSLNECNGHGAVTPIATYSFSSKPLDKIVDVCPDACTCDYGWSGRTCNYTEICDVALFYFGQCQPNQTLETYIDPTTGECIPYCSCTTPPGACSDNGSYIVSKDNPTQCSTQCQCNTGYFGDECQHNILCQDAYNALHQCNGHGTVEYNLTTQQCNDQCSCYNPTEYSGTTCIQESICQPYFNTLNCGPYGYVTPIKDDDDNEDDCSNTCTCLYGFTGNLCSTCNIRCYKGAYNPKAYCQDNINNIPPCLCSGGYIGSYCQYGVFNTDITINNRYIPQWLIKSIQNKKIRDGTSYQFLQDLTSLYLNLFNFNVNNQLTNLDSNNNVLYNRNIINIIDVPLSNMTLRSIQCQDPFDSDHNINIYSSLKFRISIRYGTHIGTLSQELQKIQATWSKISIQSNDMVIKLQELFDVYDIKRIVYMQRNEYNEIESLSHDYQPYTKNQPSPLEVLFPSADEEDDEDASENNDNPQMICLVGELDEDDVIIDHGKLEEEEVGSSEESSNNSMSMSLVMAIFVTIASFLYCLY